MGLDELLNQVETQVQNGYVAEVNSYEAEAAYEVENYLVGSKGYSRPRAASMAKNIVANPAIMSRFKPALGAAKVGGGSNGQTFLAGNDFTPATAAQFDITITRLTHAINQSLPVAIFAPQELENGYREMLAPYIPTGVTLTAVNYSELDSKPTQVDFVYTSGNDSDTLEVRCVQYPYPSFLKSAITDKFRASKMRYSLSDATILSQFSEVFNIRQASMFGKTTTNKISVGANKDPRQYQNGIIDIDGAYPIDKETGFVIGICDPGANNFRVTLSMFIEKFQRQTAAGW